MRAWILLVVGAIVLIALGVWSSAECLSRGGWNLCSGDLVPTTTIMIPPESHYYPRLIIPYPHSLKIADIEMYGEIEALGEDKFIRAHGENLSSYQFNFSFSSMNQASEIHLVVENPSAENLNVKYDVKLSWNERASWGLGFLILAVAFTSVGILLLIPARESKRGRVKS